MDKSARQEGPSDVPRWRRYLPVAVIVAGVIAYFAFGLHRYVSFETMRKHRIEMVGWVADHRLLAMAVYFVGYVLIIAFSLPIGALGTLLGGFLFGIVAGTALSVTAATIGATVVFLAARGALADVLRKRAGERFARMEHGLTRHAFSYLLFLRFVPVFPFWLLNIVPAFFRVPTRTFAATTFLGIIPGTAVYASIGAGLDKVFDKGRTPDLDMLRDPNLYLPLAGLAVLSLVPVVWSRFRSRGGKA
ncbi:MAG: TVP38/TMEM64 family protein [Alphaproteobacteria bacterium]|nr:TVP38/TMEM64 family protein [Alphaproteobacteria bacterium]MCW5741828.1 TVP38/TMEM64 family protein [Alphaproteobacteria bacterium]